MILYIKTATGGIMPPIILQHNLEWTFKREKKEGFFLDINWKDRLLVDNIPDVFGDIKGALFDLFSWAI